MFVPTFFFTKTQNRRMINDTEKDKLLRDLSLKEYAQYASLPMAVYITAERGTILELNKEAESLLKLTQADRGKASILSFYENASDREWVIDRLKQLNTNEWECNQNLRFKVQEKTHSIRFFSKPIFDAQSKYLGSICLAFVITELERFRYTSDFMPIGIFEIGNDKKVRYANSEIKKIFQTDNLIDRDVRSLFANEAEFDDILNELKSRTADFIEKGLKLRREGSHIFFAEVVVIPEFHGNKLIRSKGLLKDSTFGSFLDKVPIGLCLIINDNKGNEHFVSVNKHFAEIKGYSDPKELEGKPVINYHKNEESYRKYKQVLADAHQKGDFLEDYLLPVKTVDSIEKTVFVKAQVIKDKEENIIGRICAVYDVTNNIRKLFEEQIRRDFASLLHSSASMIKNIIDTLETVVKGHDDPSVLVNERVNIKKGEDKIAHHANSLKRSLLEYERVRKERTVPNQDEFSGKLARLIAKLDNKEQLYTKEKAAWYRLLAKKIRVFIREDLVKNTLMPRELTKRILNDSTDILRYCRILSLSITIQELDEHDMEIEAFRVALSDDTIQPKLEDSFYLEDILEQVMLRLGEFAGSRAIRLDKLYKSNVRTYMKGSKRDFYVALYNLIHNAIKYSWQKPNDEESYVSVNVEIKYEDQESKARITIENWGVAIRQEELNSGSIFEFAYRGALSNDRNRGGFGIGLWHTNKITKAHNGTLRITSEPTLGNHPTNYNHPFITTAIMELNLPKRQTKF
jgi:signal transduction histidine kinase/PAS domain-containing protein